jgi:hypothetical protein
MYLVNFVMTWAENRGWPASRGGRRSLAGVKVEVKGVFGFEDAVE